MNRTHVGLITFLGAAGLALGACGGNGTTPPPGGGNTNPTVVSNEVDRNAPIPGGFPSICCNGANVYVVWADRRNHANNFDIFFQRSTDRGATWLGADVALNRNAPGGSHSIRPVICCSGSNLYVIWLDDGDGGGGPMHMYLNSSADGGTTWRAAAVRVATGSPASNGVTGHSNIQLCCNGQTLYVTWADDRNSAGRRDVWFQTSIDGGTNWLANDRRISSWTPGSIRNDPQDPKMCCAGQNVYVTWSDRRNNVGVEDDMWFLRSTDGGATWPNAETRIDRAPAGRFSGDYAICCDGQRVYVAWLDGRNGTNPLDGLDVYLNTSADGGANFSATDYQVNATPLAAASLSAEQPSICCQGSTVHVAWQDNRTPTNVVHVQYQKSTNAGVSYQATDTRMDPTGPRVENSSPVWICCEGTNLHVTFRSGPTDDVKVNSSADSGATWRATPVTVQNPPTGMAGTNDRHPPLCCDGARPYVVWQDPRGNAPASIWFGTYN